MWREFKFSPPLDLEAGMGITLPLGADIPDDGPVVDVRVHTADWGDKDAPILVEPLDIQAALSEAFTESPD